jgi:hypothetical protein
MDKNPTFFRLCAREAASGTFERANAIATIVGGVILSALAWWLGGTKMEAPTSVAGTIGFGVVLSILSLLVSWFFVFLWRLYGAPSRLYWSERQKIKDLEKEKLALETRLVPKIRVFLDSKDKGVREYPAVSGSSAKWVQFCVSCATETPLIACEAFLTSVTKIDGDEIGSELVEEPIHCNWSQLSESDRKITIPPRIIQYVNLFTVNNSPLYVVPQTTPKKLRLPEAIQVPGRYQIGVVVTAENTTSAPATFVFEWRDFNDVKLMQTS